METRETRTLILYDNGTIRSKKTKRLLTMTPGVNGYYFICWTYEDGRRGRRSVHRIMAEAFISNPLDLPCVNHIDGNRNNNSITNLEWCTHKHNTDHSIIIGLQNPKGETNANSKLTEDQARAIKYSHSELSQQAVAKMYNVSKTIVKWIRSGERWSHI